MHPTIEEMVQRILLWRHVNISVPDLRRWTEDLRDSVQPQLDEREALKARVAELEAQLTAKPRARGSHTWRRDAAIGNRRIPKG